MTETPRILLTAALDSFLADCRAANLSPNTLRFYAGKLPILVGWLAGCCITSVHEVDAAHLRTFFTYLHERHTAGGVDAYWRAVSAFFNFLERDGAIVGNPLRRLRRPQVDTPLQPPIAPDVVRALIRACRDGGRTHRRDLVIIHILLDTGLRANELLRLNVGDVDLDSGSVQIHKAKSRKGRVVFISARTRRLLSAYLRGRLTNRQEPLLLTQTSEPRRLTYDGLRAMIAARADQVGVDPPPLHAFRRTFAITAWRSGVDLVTLTRLMGHGSLPVLMRYIAAESDDLDIHKRQPR